MKKTSFLKGLAMAAVALVCAFTTSCSEEELKINGSQITLPKAVATLTVSLVDLEVGTTLEVNTEDVTGSMGQVISVPCPARPGYTIAESVNVSIPTVADGQAVNIPVTFYVVNINSALTEIVASMKPVEDSEKVVADETIAALNAAEDFKNETAYDKKVTANFEIFTGEEFAGFVEEGRVANNLGDILSNAMKFGKKKATVDITIAPWCQAVVKVDQKITTKEYTATYNGETKTFTVKQAGMAFFTADYSVIPGKEHDFAHNNHGHGHGHGSSDNAGGGISIAE